MKIKFGMEKNNNNFFFWKIKSITNNNEINLLSFSVKETKNNAIQFDNRTTKQNKKYRSKTIQNDCLFVCV